MTKEKEKEKEEEVGEEELSRYEELVKERLELLKKGFDDFPSVEGDEEGNKLPGFIMMHIAQLYTRLDLTLGEMEEVQTKVHTLIKASLPDMYAQAKEDFEKELAKEPA